MDRVYADVAVIGGGPGGVCAAIAAARLGLSVALAGNRPVLGGNSSSEIRVWTRGAVGAGNLFAEEMGVWGRLKLENLYKNPEANPVFWDEILLDNVLLHKNIQLYLNTDITDICLDNGVVTAVTGCQQGTEKTLRIEARFFIDATGDGTLGARAGLPYYMGERRMTDADRGDGASGLLGSSILYYTRREDHPVAFVPPAYACGMEEIEQILNHGGRVVSEKLSGSDCWWFEYGGQSDTIAHSQDIAIELKRLVMGVWNYIKNSGKFDADHYTLDWIGSLPGKRESRRMETEYLLREADLLENRTFPDAAFYGGWYMDFHPVGGIRDSGEANCVQIPVNVYQIPLRCLYRREVKNLLFAGRDIGTERGAFVSSRVMNTCALSGQAAATLAWACIRDRCPPEALTPEQIRAIQQTLLREDMLIPGVAARDERDLIPAGTLRSSSTHSGGAAPSGEAMALEQGGFVVFPGLGGKELQLSIESEGIAALKWTLSSSLLPSRLREGRGEGAGQWQLRPGDNQMILTVPESCGGRFCTLTFAPTAGTALLLARDDRTGFVCGHREEPQYYAPLAAYRSGEGGTLYGPANVSNGCSRPWGTVNQWSAAPEDKAPWLECRWERAQTLRKIILYFDPELSMEIPSSRAAHWEDSHLYAPRRGMPPQLVKAFRLQVLDREGRWKTVWQQEDNYQRMVDVTLPEAVTATALRVLLDETWGDRSPALYGLRAYAEKL